MLAARQCASGCLAGWVAAAGCSWLAGWLAAWLAAAGWLAGWLRTLEYLLHVRYGCICIVLLFEYYMYRYMWKVGHV